MWYHTILTYNHNLFYQVDSKNSVLLMMELEERERLKSDSDPAI